MRNYCLIAMTCMALFAAAPAVGDSVEGAQDAVAAEERNKGKSRDQPASNDTARCKREAQGLDGPERSRFMTECLKREWRTGRQQ